MGNWYSDNTTQRVFDNSKAQRREICARHAWQVQQQWSPELDRREEFWPCSSASFEECSAQLVLIYFIKERRNKMAAIKEQSKQQPKGTAMKTPPIVSQQEWEAARQQMLAKDKACTRSRDALAAERRRMPWTLVEKNYKFERPNGKVSLLELSEGRKQLIVYRAFFEPGVFGWPEHACRGCSLGADQVAHLAHLNARDTTLAYASRASQPDIARLKARMDWEVTWYTMTDGFH